MRRKRPLTHRRNRFSHRTIQQLESRQLLAVMATDNTAMVTEDTAPTDSGNLLTDDDGSGIDSDSLGNPISVASVNGITDPNTNLIGSFGSLDWAGDGSYTYTASPAVNALRAGEVATDEFTYTAQAAGMNQTLSQYSFNGGTPSATTTASGVAVSAITSGSLSNFNPNFTAAYSTAPTLQVNPPASATNETQAVALDSYFEFTATPNTAFSLQSLTFNAGRGGGSTARGWALRSSLDGYTATLGTDPTVDEIRPNFTPYVVDLSGAQFQDVTDPITFRMYIFTPATGNSLEFDDITLIGNTPTTDTATLTVSVVGTNDAPTANADNVTATDNITASENGTANIPAAVLTANDTDPDIGVPTGTVQIDTDFADATGFNLVGSATVTGGVLQLNPATGGQQGLAWTTNRVNLEDGFTADFDFSFPGSSNPGADGVGFSIQNDANNLNNNEDGPGAGALTVTFDTYNNSNGDNPPRTFIRVFYDGNVIAERSLIEVFPGTPDLSGTIGNTANIQLVNNQLSVNINGANILSNVPVDLAAIGAVDGSGAAFVGFSGRTGGQFEAHNIENFTLTSFQFPSPDQLSIQSVASTGVGTVTLNGDGSVTYDPNGQFESLPVGGTVFDSFTYTVTDGNGGTDTAVATITITGENDAPTATDDDNIFVSEDGPAVVIDVLANDTDPDSGTSQLTPAIVVDDFTGNTDFTLTGSATFTGGNLQLTPSATSQQGVAWTNQRVVVGDGFRANFTFGFPNPIGSGADGMIFSVQTISNTANGGLGGPADSLTVVFDSYQNGSEPSGSLARVFAGGVQLAQVDLSPFDLTGSLGNTALIDYTPGSLTVTLNGNDLFGSLNVDLDSINAIDSAKEAFVGFGAYTGGAAEEHNINSFTLETVLVTPPDTLAVDTIRYNDFSMSTDLQLNGTATLDGNVLELVQNQNNQSGSAYLTAKQSVADGFRSSFQFEFTEPTGGGADGMSFVVHNDTAGASQPGNEAGPTANALTIEIDSYDNGAGDPSSANIKVRTPSSGGILTIVDLNTAPLNIPDLSNSGPHTIEVSYDGALLDITFDGVLIVDDLAVDLVAAGAVDANGEAFIGLGSRTGGANEVTRIYQFSVTAPTTQTLPSGAVITRNPDGTIAYDPNGSFESLPVGAVATDSFTYSITDGNGGTDTATATVTINGANDAPTANAGGPYAINEGGSVIIDASASTDPDTGDTFTYNFDLDNDGMFDDATSTTPMTTITWAQLQAAGVNDGSMAGTDYTIGVQVDDGNGGTSSATTTLTVTNVAPAAAVTPTSATVLIGRTAMFTVSADDVSDADDAGTFTYAADLNNDGDTADPGETQTGPMSGVSFGASFANEGTYVLDVTVTDKDGDSTTATFTLNVVPVGFDPDLNAVVAEGSDTENDRIVFGSNNDGIRVRFNDDTYDIPASLIDANTRLIANGRAGSDTIVIVGLDMPSEIDGGASNDYIAGGTGADTILGGTGNDRILAGEGDNYIDGGEGADRLEGRSGIDVIFGGFGNDNINGGAGDDILDGGDGTDVLFGGDGDDLLVGGTGSDNLRGYLGNDVLIGGDDSDRLYGDQDNDLLIGGGSSDRIRGDNGFDDLVGGTSDLETDIDAVLAAMMGSLGTDLATADAANNNNVASALASWFGSSDRSGFAGFNDDMIADELNGGFPDADEFHDEVDDRYRNYDETNGDSKF